MITKEEEKRRKNSLITPVKRNRKYFGRIGCRRRHDFFQLSKKKIIRRLHFLY